MFNGIQYPCLEALRLCYEASNCQANTNRPANRDYTLTVVGGKGGLREYRIRANRVIGQSGAVRGPRRLGGPTASILKFLSIIFLKVHSFEKMKKMDKKVIRTLFRRKRFAKQLFFITLKPRTTIYWNSYHVLNGLYPCRQWELHESESL